MENHDEIPMSPFGDGSPVHDIGDQVGNWWDEHKGRIGAGVLGAGAIAGGLALAPELSAGGLIAGGLSGLEAAGVNTGLMGAMGLIL